MNRRAELNLSENIPCDIKAGLGKTSHSPIAVEDKTVNL